MTSPNYLDRSKVFYPLVMNYISQLVGIRHLLLIGISSKQKLFVVDEALKVSKQFMDEDISIKEELITNLKKLMGPLELRSDSQCAPIIVNIQDIAREFIDNSNYLLKHSILSAGSLLILAHELCKERPCHDTSPLWEFLRHCRNAAAHGGKFHFIGEEPKRPAKWGNIEITKALRGTTLFKGSGEPGFISLGDPIRLLLDIEQAYEGLDVGC